MEQLIIDCLLANKTIVIPTIGALTITNEDTREAMLLTFLKSDNKELKKIYAEVNNCSLEEAEERVDQYTSQLKDELESGKQRSFLNFGVLYKNSDGEFEFSSSQKQLTDEVVEHSIPQVEEEIMPVVESPVEEEIKSDVVEPIVEPIEEVLLEEKEGIIETPSAEIVEENVPSKDEVIEAVSEDSKPPLEEEMPKKRKKKGGLFILLFFLILGGLVFFFWKDIQTLMNPAEETVEEVVDNEKEETLPQEASEQEEDAPVEIEDEPYNEAVEEQEEVIEAPQSVVQATGDYHVIVGAFSVQDNANRLVNELNEKGYTAQMIDNNGMFLVSMYHFSDKSQAGEKAKEVGNSWIFKK